MSAVRLFISHSHQDKALADALYALIKDVLGAAVVIEYSSDDAPGGGIRAGGTWLEWIMTTVRQTDVCVVILTEDSAGAPWVTWETGAVTGVAMGDKSASEGTGSRIRVVPLTFGIDATRVPGPLQPQQAVSGDRETGVRKLLFVLQERCGSSARAREAVDKSVATFIATVRKFMERRAREHPARLRAVDLSPVHFVNSRLGLTLEPRNGEIANSVRLQCGPFTGDAHQRWLLYQVAPETYRIATADGTKCLSLQNDLKKAGAAVILWGYEKHRSQHWRVTTASGAAGVLSTVTLVNTWSGHFLSSAVDTTDVVQARGANVTNEDWWMLLAGRI